ncbi:DUF4355 domain-containing protein [Limosilactobacillus sp. STM2_1]|uniref:DUF4355 domain-containing protein n=1 Tax=Limosilactobacillus rudii TaxID=2759755 RepID=A0A7W3YLX0_9LACO|nr:DUF4355 domain-containing protein [Limosilactobacillus rudii]MBB1080242.1 DUF4355 domain-containing protein [Limosilactobacillus rudii]MBB1096854.1 DUF4355 domain-containing protein [Limosilactobacillus rudii]MCD7133752.1 DUF4355 domain-containing protein [Limosilactobacillus rudii]
MEKVRFYSNLLSLNLQRFADEGQGEGGDNGATDTENEDANTGNNPDEQSKPFMTFNTQSELDSYFDKKLSKALGTARSNWEKEQDDKAKKAKDLKKMSPEERQEYDLKQREQALTDREAEVTKRENKSKLASRLVDDGLPTGLADVFDDVLANEDNMNETYERVSEAFRSAVHDAVETRLAQSARPPKSADNNSEQKSAGEIFAEKANNANKSKDDFWK